MKVLKPDKSGIGEAVRYLKTGCLVAFPTETVYGLGAVFNNEIAVKKIYQAKNRPADNPIIAHIASWEQFYLLTESAPDWVLSILKSAWPGPLSVVLPHKGKVGSWVTSGLGTVSIRWPSNKVAQQLLADIGVPIVAPSANLSGRPSATNIQHVLDDFGSNSLVVAGIDGGQCEVGIESTVLLIDLEKEEGVILRAGFYDDKQLSGWSLGRSVYYNKRVKDDDFFQPLSPGQKYRHYAPDVPVRLVWRKDLPDQIPFNVWLWAVKPSSQVKAELVNEQNLFYLLRLAERKPILEVWIIRDGLEESSGLADRILKASLSSAQ